MPRKSTGKSFNIFRPKPKTSAKPKPEADLGTLPEWNLEDLYPSMDSKAFKSDLAKAQSESKSFNAAYRGKLEALAKKIPVAGFSKRSSATRRWKNCSGASCPMPGSSIPATRPTRRG